MLKPNKKINQSSFFLKKYAVAYLRKWLDIKKLQAANICFQIILKRK